MGSISIDEDLVEEREELVVSYNSRPTLEKACFLKPSVSSIDGFEGIHAPSPSSELKASYLNVFFRGWKLPNKNFKSWAKKMAALHKPIWLKSGIFDAIEASTYRINKNPFLILSLAHKWCSETNTFVFPWGEATITLEDVNVILGFSVSGSSVFADLKSSEMEEAIEKLENRRKVKTNEALWISSFVDDKMEHEAFLALWLSKFVFPDQTGTSIRKYAIRIAVRLARGERIALAPAVLAILYRDLGRICSLSSTSKDYFLKSCLFKLVQVWIWERFKNIRPEAKEIQKGEPRIAQWSGLKQKFNNVGMILFDGNFEWRPYAQPLKNWNPPRFYLEDAKWVRIDKSLDVEEDDEFEAFARFARVCKLIGTGGIVENYYPNRVARQFGFAQDFPVLVTNHRSYVTKQEVWDDYNRSLVGLKLYVPSRFTTAMVTARYQEWWTKSVSEMQKKSNETFNVVDHYDDDDDDTVLVKVLELCPVQKLDDGLMNKRACEDDENAETDDDDNMTTSEWIRSRKKCSDVENAWVLPLSQFIPKGKRSMNKRCKRARELEDDDNMTISELIKSVKKCGDDVEKNGKGERSRLEVDNNVLDHEIVARQETEQKNDENNSSNGVAEQEEEEVDERVKQRKLAQDFPVLVTEGEAWVLPLSKVIPKGKRWMNKRCKRAREDDENSEREDDDGNMTIAEKIESTKKCNDDVEKNAKGERNGPEVDNNVSDNDKGEINRLEVDNNVSDVTQKLAVGDETVATQETERKNDEKNTSNGVAEQQEDDVGIDERLKQRKLAIWELALKCEARILKVENTLAKIKQWKLRQSHTTPPAST